MFILNIDLNRRNGDKYELPFPALNLCSPWDCVASIIIIIYTTSHKTIYNIIASRQIINASLEVFLKENFAGS